MKVNEIYKQLKKPSFSIEVSPPINGHSLEPLLNTIKTLKRFNPAWCNVTCGAFGKPRGGTIPISSIIKKDLGIEPVVHIISMGRSRQDIENLLVGMKYEGIENILALRGDPPAGSTSFRPHPEGHQYAYELVRQINQIKHGKYLSINPEELRDGEPADLCTSVAGYPEGHPGCQSIETDLQRLKLKVDEGADYITTQLFFKAEYYFRFVANARRIGINVPIIPGIMPIESWDSLKFIINQKLRISIPDNLSAKLKYYHEKDDRVSSKKYGTEYISTMCEELLDGGAPGIHIYTMNSSAKCLDLIESLYPRYFI